MYLIVGIFALAVIVLALAFFVPQEKILSETELNVRLIVSNKTGFNVTNDTLDFGKLAAYTSGSKKIILSNNFERRVKVLLSARGNVSDFLVFDEVLYIASGETLNYTIYTKEISDEAFGKYSGTLLVQFVEGVRLARPTPKMLVERFALGG